MNTIARLAAVALALTAMACDDDSSGGMLNPASGGTGSDVTVTNATPADGNATLTVLGSYTPNAFGTGYDELNLSETTGSVGHDLTITWDMNTQALHAVQHGWGSGFTQCVMGTANPCDPAKVAIDIPGQRVTFSGLVLIDDVFNTPAACTLTNTARW